MDFLAGQILLFNKPMGWTSFDVVAKVRNTLRIKKVGHAGTLDPLASGLLILCTGRATKSIDAIQAQAKTYETCFKLGATTASYDAETPEVPVCDATQFARPEIEAAMRGFAGEITQTPPIYSAVKVGGRRAYEAARAGQTPELKTRQVHIYDFTLLDNPEPACWCARIGCSKGTYIRSLVHDLGQTLGCGAYIRSLVRTRIGDYDLADAWEIGDFVQQFGRNS
ncbi:MAG: tRNA pseudouridine(55) synthase TruB [Bacteroidia bacterium]